MQSAESRLCLLPILISLPPLAGTSFTTRGNRCCADPLSHRDGVTENSPAVGLYETGASENKEPLQSGPNTRCLRSAPSAHQSMNVHLLLFISSLSLRIRCEIVWDTWGV